MVTVATLIRVCYPDQYQSYVQYLLISKSLLELVWLPASRELHSQISWRLFVLSHSGEFSASWRTELLLWNSFRTKNSDGTDKCAVRLSQLVFSQRKLVPREEKRQLRQNKWLNERTSVVPTATPLQLKQFNKYVVECVCIRIYNVTGSILRPQNVSRNVKYSSFI